jgi:hypothetical protein
MRVDIILTEIFHKNLSKYIPGLVRNNYIRFNLFSFKPDLIYYRIFVVAYYSYYGIYLIISEINDLPTTSIYL